MLRLASDVDVNGDILRGIRRQSPDIDLIRVQDVLPKDTADKDILAWAAAENRVLISNDRNTTIGFAIQRAATQEKTTGIIITTNEQSVGAAIEDILLIATCMSEQEMQNQVVVYLPYRG